MKNLVIKYVLISFAVFLTLPACVKEMVFDIHNTSREVVVTCLFNPEENWELTLSKTKILQEDKNIFINDALVEITSETGEHFTLNYTGKKGIYDIDSHPEMGKTYTLNIDIPGHDEITAQSKVPNFVKATVPDFEIKWIKYLYPNNLMDYDVFPLRVNFEESINDARFMFRARTFNPSGGYKRYMLTMASLTKLEEEGLPTNGYKKLLELVDQWRIGSFDYIECVLNLIEDYETRSKYSHLLQEKIKQKTVPNREYEAFYKVPCFEDDNWLNNISYDAITVIGKGQNITKANLLYADQNLKYSMENNNNNNNIEEFWLEVIRGDRDYLKYYKTYILQVSQRINPYSDPVMVHSNIKNATGIFAGFNRQMIYLFTY